MYMVLFFGDDGIEVDSVVSNQVASFTTPELKKIGMGDCVFQTYEAALKYSKEMVSDAEDGYVNIIVQIAGVVQATESKWPASIAYETVVV